MDSDPDPSYRPQFGKRQFNPKWKGVNPKKNDYRVAIRSTRKKVKKVFLVHGEVEAKDSFKEKLIHEGYLDVEIPGKGKTYTLD